MLRDTFDKILIKFTVKKIPEGIPMKLENRFFFILKHQEIRFLKRVIFSEKSHCAEKPKNTLQVRKTLFSSQKFFKKYPLTE